MRRAYEFYVIDGNKRHERLGVFPERRRNPMRITRQSIMDWAEGIVGCESAESIYFIPVMIDERTGTIYRPTPVFITYTTN
jgi:hypothetical protein